MGFPGDSVVKNLPAVQEPQKIWVQSLGQEDPLKEGRAAHSRILTWRIPWTEEPGRLQSVWLQRAGHDWSDLARAHTCTHKVFNINSKIHKGLRTNHMKLWFVS